MEINTELLRRIVQEVLEQANGIPACDPVAGYKLTDPSGVLCIKAKNVEAEPYDVGVPAKVSLRDLVSLEESPDIGCGILEIENSSYPWKLTYEEFYYVVDGTLEIMIDGRKVVGNKDDIIYIPKNTSIHFSSPASCRAIYFTYPADWEGTAKQQPAGLAEPDR